jgi:hypothetical protein
MATNRTEPRLWWRSFAKGASSNLLVATLPFSHALAPHCGWNSWLLRSAGVVRILNDNGSINSSESIAIPLASSRISGPENAAVATPIAVDQVAGPATALANLQESISVFPFSVEDWSTYLDIIQADNELGYDLGV